MAEGAMFCGQFFVVAVVMCCTASAQADVVNTYYNMTNGFLDVVQPKARAEDVIGRLITKSSSFASVSTSLLDQISSEVQQILIDYIGMTICIVLGLVLTVAMFVGCLCFGPRRLCGACGAGIKKKTEQKSDKTKRTVLALVLVTLVLLVAGGVAGTFLAGQAFTEQWRPASDSSDETPRFITSIITALSQFEDFLRSITQAFDHLVAGDNVQKLLDSLQDLMNSNLMTVKANLNETLTTTSTLLANLTAGLSSVNSSLTDIKTTSASLVNQQSELNMTLLNISTFARNDINSCSMSSCTTLRASLDNLHAGPPYSFPAVDSSLTTVQDAHKTISDIDLNFQLPDNSLQSLSGTINETISSIKDSLKVALNAFNLSQILQDEILQQNQGIIGEISYYGGDLGLTILTLISSFYVVILGFFVAGLLIGVCAKPRTAKSAVGTRAMSEWMFVAGSGSTCLISGIVMLVVLLFFVFGGFMYVELCRGILYDQDNGNIFKVFDSVSDSLWSSLFSSSSVVNLTGVSVYDILFVKCKNNEGTFDVLLEFLDVQQLLSQVPDLNLDFLNSTVANIIPANVFQQLDDVTNSLSSSIDFNSFRSLLNDPVSEENLLTVANQMDAAANDVGPDEAADLKSQAAWLRTIQNTDVAAINTAIDSLNSSLSTLEAQLAANGPVVMTTTALSDNLRQLQSELYSQVDMLSKSLPSQFAELLQQQLSMLTNATRCGSLYNAVYGTFLVICWDFLSPLNALWFTFGWSITLLTPSIIIGLWLGGLYARKPAGEKSKTQTRRQKDGLTRGDVAAYQGPGQQRRGLPRTQIPPNRNPYMQRRPLPPPPYSRPPLSRAPPQYRPGLPRSPSSYGSFPLKYAPGPY